MRYLFVAVLAGLVAGNVVTFLELQDPEAVVPGAGSHYQPIRPREHDSLAGLRRDRWEVIVLGYLRLQDLLRGAVLVVPEQIQLDPWSWRHMVLAELRRVPGSRTMTTLVRSDVIPVRSGRVFVPEDFDPLPRDPWDAAAPRRTVHVVEAGPKNAVYLVPEADLEALTRGPDAPPPGGGGS
jgi:hypothetical protein